MGTWRTIVATLVMGLMVGTGVSCKKPPTDALSEAEDAVASARTKSECAKEKFEAAEKLLEEAESLAADKQYDRAERKARAAEKLAQKAERIAEENWEDCQDRLADDTSEQDNEEESTTDEKPSPESRAELRTIYFDYDSSELSSEARDKLEENVRWMEQHPDTRVIIEGHTDSRGSIEYNLALGERRARSVKEYLVQMGVSGGRLNILSYGEEKPAAYGDSKSAYRKNRRVEFQPKK